MATNIIIVTGNLGRDPEMAYTEKGLPITKVSIAVSQPDKKGAKVPPIWFNVVFFGKQAESFNEWMKKGDTVTVHGRFSEDHYVGKDGIGKKWQCIEASGYDIVNRKSREAVAAGSVAASENWSDWEEHPF